jgi:hypothetical protein
MQALVNPGEHTGRCRISGTTPRPVSTLAGTAWTKSRANGNGFGRAADVPTGSCRFTQACVPLGVKFEDPLTYLEFSGASRTRKDTIST